MTPRDEVIRSLRQAGWSTGEVAQKVGLSASRVSQIAGIPKERVYQASELKVLITPKQREYLGNQGKPMSVYVRALIQKDMEER